jgi:ATP-binding cassette subfamily F protein uup
VSIIAGVEVPDDGLVATRKNLRLAYVPQESRFAPGATVRSILAEALQNEANLDEYERDSRMNVAAGRVGLT